MLFKLVSRSKLDEYNTSFSKFNLIIKNQMMQKPKLGNLNAFGKYCLINLIDFAFSENRHLVKGWELSALVLEDFETLADFSIYCSRILKLIKSYINKFLFINSIFLDVTCKVIIL